MLSFTESRIGITEANVIRAIFTLMGALDGAISFGLGWRYLLSATFRAAVHHRWRSRSAWAVALEILLHLAVFTVVNGVLILFAGLIGLWLYRGIIVPRLAP